MRRSKFAVAMLFLLLLPLASCGRKKAESATYEEILSENVSGSEPENAEEAENPEDTENVEDTEDPEDAEDVEDPWMNTCWQADRYTINREGQIMEGTLPEEDWTIELYLLEDGAARYREWSPQTFDYIGTCHLLLGIEPDCFWYPDGNGGFFLSTDDGGTEEDAVFAQGHMADGQLLLDSFGDRFWMRQQPMPARGGEYCMADLFGQWRMVSGETVTEGEPEVWSFTADEMEINRTLTFHSSWDSEEPNGVDYYDEWHPGYLREARDMTADYQETPVYEGCGNEAWRLRLSAAKPVYQNYMEEEFYVTVLDADTLLFQMRLRDTDGILTTSTQIFSRLN